MTVDDLFLVLLVLPTFSVACGCEGAGGGASELLVPNRPRFIILAGVTGISCSGVAAVLFGVLCPLVPGGEFDGP